MDTMHKLGRVAFVAVVGLLARCGSTHFSDDAGTDASVSDAGGSDGSSDANVFGDVAASDASADASCGFGNAGSFATQSSLDLFGQTMFFADGGPLPAGHYEIAYVDGCMKYSSTQDWTVNAYAEDAGTNDRWYVVNGPGGEAGPTLILM